jgi:hypothetical protein
MFRNQERQNLSQPETHDSKFEIRAGIPNSNTMHRRPQQEAGENAGW